MDEKSKILLRRLQASDPADLDEDEIETLHFLEEQEEKESSQTASVEDAIRAGGSRGHPDRQVCVKCGSTEISSRNLQFKRKCWCEGCGHSWEGGPPPPMFVPGTTTPGITKGPYARPEVDEYHGLQQVGHPRESRFRNPKKVR